MLPLDSGFAVALSAAALATPAGTIETVGPARAAGVVVYAEPDGHAIVRLRAKTPYGGRLRLWVRERRGEWIKVAVEDGPGGTGWVRGRDTRPASTLKYRIRLDRSAKRLTVIGRRARWSTTVVIGGAASPTPVGTFQITDRLDGARYRGVYGARILVLSAYGDPKRATRVAIHGVPPAAKSKAFSAGCVRVPRAALLRLYREAPPGTPVRVVDSPRELLDRDTSRRRRRAAAPPAARASSRSARAARARCRPCCGRAGGGRTPRTPR
jgi:lipoprotein-anchoring transpeptidase ErfK/SrfK